MNTDTTSAAAFVTTIVLRIFAMGPGTTARNIVECVLMDLGEVAPEIKIALGNGSLGVAFTALKADPTAEVVALTGSLDLLALAEPALVDSGVTDPPALHAARARLRALRKAAA